MDAPGPSGRATLREARAADAPAIHALIAELAAYERLAHEVRSTPDLLAQALFGPGPRVFCELAELDGEVVGLALWFYDFSTFEGRHGVYLEDLFVRPSARGRGLGRALMARLAARCAAEGLARLTWAVLDWNAPAIGFYRGLGARLMDDWTICRLEGDALRRLGGGR